MWLWTIHWLLRDEQVRSRRLLLERIPQWTRFAKFRLRVEGFEDAEVDLVACCALGRWGLHLRADIGQRLALQLLWRDDVRLPFLHHRQALGVPLDCPALVLELDACCESWFMW